MADRTCSIDGCDRKVRARGWCATHHQRWRLGIDMAPPIRTGGAEHNDHDRREAMVRGFDTGHIEIPFEVAE